MDKRQQYIQELVAPEGLRYGVLFSYAPGKKIRNLTPGLCYRSGTLMAKMHQVTEDMRIQRVNYSLQVFTIDPFAWAEEHFAKTNEDLLFLQKQETFFILFLKAPARLKCVRA